MSNLKSNILKLEEVKENINNLPNYKSLSNQGNVNDLLYDKQLFDSDGNIIIGTRIAFNEDSLITGEIENISHDTNKIGDNVFMYCNNLSYINFPACTTIGSSAFAYCSSLTSVYLPVCTSIGVSAFEYCTSLTSVSFPACTSIGSSAFYGCTSLASLILEASSVCTLADVTAFYSTPMSLSTYTGSFGSIYVPASLVDAYKSATNWVTYSNRITGII